MRHFPVTIDRAGILETRHARRRQDDTGRGKVCASDGDVRPISTIKRVADLTVDGIASAEGPMNNPG